MKNKNYVTGAIIAVVVLVAAGAVLATRNSNSSMSSMNMSKNSTSKASTMSSNTNMVSIKDYAFSPTNITVKVGTKVTWTNQDDVGHTVTADNPSSDAPDSSTFAKGESYSFTFKKAGTYDYHCTPHPYMKGTVVVTE